MRKETETQPTAHNQPLEILWLLTSETQQHAAKFIAELVASKDLNLDNLPKTEEDQRRLLLTLLRLHPEGVRNSEVFAVFSLLGFDQTEVKNLLWELIGLRMVDQDGLKMTLGSHATR